MIVFVLTHSYQSIQYQHTFYYEHIELTLPLQAYNKMSSKKANDLLKALNSQIQHHNAPQPQPQPSPSPVVVDSSQNIPTNRSKQQKQPMSMQINMPKQQPFGQDLKYQQGKQAPQFLTEMLMGQIGGDITDALSEVVESMLKQRQKNAYDSYTKGGQNQYIKVMFQQATRSDKNDNLSAVNDLMLKRAGRIQNALEKGKLYIDFAKNISNRKQFQYLQKIDMAMMIKIKDGELRSKMDALNERMSLIQNLDHIQPDQQQKMYENEIHRRVADNMQAQSFALDSQKTKIARQYVKHMHRQRRLSQKRKNQRDHRYMQDQKQRDKDLKAAEEMHDQAKRKEIVNRIQIRRKRLDQQQKQIKTKQEQVSVFLAKYHRKLPIFRLKQKQFVEKYLKNQQKMRQDKLKEIRDNRRSLSMNEINAHQKKYMQRLSLQQQKKKQQVVLLQKSKKSSEVVVSPYFRGKAHSRIETMTKQEVLRKKAQLEAARLKVNKRKQYSHVVSQSHRPSVDQQKKKQLLEFIQDDMMRKKHAKKLFKQIVDQQTNQVRFQAYYQQITKKNTQTEGNKFFQQSKKMMKKKKDEPIQQVVVQQKHSSKSASPKSIKMLKSSASQPQKQQKNIWQIRAKQMMQFAKTDIVDAQKFEYLKKNINNLDDKAASRQFILKHGNLSLDEHMEQKGKLDQYYMESIRQKMKLLE